MQADQTSDGADIATAMLYEAVEHVLIASEDNGDMDDIDWNKLRDAISYADHHGRLRYVGQRS